MWLLTRLKYGFGHSSMPPDLMQFIFRLPSAVPATVFFCAPIAVSIIAMLEAIRARSALIYGLWGMAVPVGMLAVWAPHVVFGSPDRIDLGLLFVFAFAGFAAGAAYRLVRRYTFEFMPAQMAAVEPPDTAG